MPARMPAWPPRKAAPRLAAPMLTLGRSDVPLASHMIDSLRSDTVFGWRQLTKRKVTSAAAILSLALAIGACTSAFRLIDALLLRPLPVAEPERLYALARQGMDPGGNFRITESSEYPLFRTL